MSCIQKYSRIFHEISNTCFDSKQVRLIAIRECTRTMQERALRMSPEKFRVLKENENIHFNNAGHVSNERRMERLRFEKNIKRKRVFFIRLLCEMIL